MPEQSSSYDLARLFATALQAVKANQGRLNALDENGNHGDNLVANLRLVANTLRKQGSAPPADALRTASKILQKQGKGGTSQYYAKGLDQAARQLEGRSTLDPSDVISIVTSLLSAIPSKSKDYPQEGQSIPTALDSLLGLAGGQATSVSETGGLLGQISDMLAGQFSSSAQPSSAADRGLDVGDVLGVLVPAGLAFLQAKQSGADTTAAAVQAVLAALMSRRVDPLQAGTPRAAGAGLVAQAILQALTR